MESQNSVRKRIIWAVSMVVLCIFLTFFLSMFLGCAFPKINIIYKVGIPVLVFVVLGVISFGMQSFFMPFIRNLSIPKRLKKAFPIIIIGLGIVMGQLYYDEHLGSAITTEIFEKFAINGIIYETKGSVFESIYQNGISILCVLFGNTVFAVSFYNRVYLIVSAILLFFAIKNITGKTFAANLFLILFFFSKQTLELMVKMDAGVVYLFLVAGFLFSVSIVYFYRTKTTNFIAQIISVFVMGCLFAVLFISESNSIIFALPAILVSFSGRKVQDDRWYYILAVEGMILILVTCAVVFILKPEIVLNFAFDLPAIGAVDTKMTTLLILNALGFVGVYGMWNQKLYYIVPAVMSIYFMLAKPDFSSGVNGELIGFLCFALYAALGTGMLENLSLVEEENEEDEYEEMPQEVTKKAGEIPEKVIEPPVTKEEKENQEDINTIKAMNKKLNQVDSGFVPMTFKKPKRQEKKKIDFVYEPTMEEMKYDIEVADDDDFDI